MTTVDSSNMTRTSPTPRSSKTRWHHAQRWITRAQPFAVAACLSIDFRSGVAELSMACSGVGLSGVDDHLDVESAL
jgi:hypothetical protein